MGDSTRTGASPRGSSAASRKPSGRSASTPRSAEQRRARAHRRRQGGLWLLGLLLLAAAALWMTMRITLDYLEVREVTLPDLVGRSLSEVEQQLIGLGLSYERYDEQHSSLNANHITSQSPRAGSVIRQGRRVLLGVSTPEQAVTLLALEGMREEDALATLASLNLVAASTRYVHDAEQPAGTVLASDPVGSSVLAPASPVTLTVSRGPEAAKLTMPQLVGLSLTEARQRLQALGVKQVDTVVAGVGDSRVMQHVPVAGKQVLANTPVTLYHRVNNGNLVRVPDLTGRSLQEAYDAITRAGLTTNTRWIQYLNDSNAASGVVTQSPAGGWTLRDAPIALVVNQGYDTRTTNTARGAGLTGSPTGVGPVSGYNPNLRLSDIIGDSTLPSTIQPPTLDGSTLDASPLDGRGIGLLGSNRTSPNSATSNPTVATPSTLAPVTTLQPSNTLPPVASDGTTVLRPLPPSSLPLPDAPIINPLPSQPNPLAPPLPSPAAPSSPLAPLPPSGSGSSGASGSGASGGEVPARSLPISFDTASYGFLQGRNFRYRLIVRDSQGERTVIDRQMRPGDSIRERITVYGAQGQVELRTYIDEDYFQAWNP